MFWTCFKTKKTCCELVLKFKKTPLKLVLKLKNRLKTVSTLKRGLEFISKSFLYVPKQVFEP